MRSASWLNGAIRRALSRRRTFAEPIKGSGSDHEQQIPGETRSQLSPGAIVLLVHEGLRLREGEPRK
jgi:hypothetical protein